MLTEERKAWLREFGARVKQCRKQQNMSQETLATLLGYEHKTSISKIECGINDIPRSKVEEIAYALNTSVGYLMGWADQPLVLVNAVNVRLSEEEAAFIIDLRKCAPNIRSAAMKMVRDSAMENKPETEDTAFTHVS